MSFLFKPLVWYFLATTLLLGIWFNKPVEASLALVDPRINRIESQLRSLQSQVTRLQSQLPRAGERQPVTSSAPPAESSVEQQFDHLAVLIIELQERVSVLETKLAQPTEDPRQN